MTLKPIFISVTGFLLLAMVVLYQKQPSSFHLTGVAVVGILFVMQCVLAWIAEKTDAR